MTIEKVDTAHHLDPITYEILRNRMTSVTEEMRITLQTVSGSPTVTDATDFFTGLYIPDGSFATMGFQVAFEAPPVGAFIRHLLNSGRTPIRPGDMFVGNDPYVGALHQNDVQMACPIFFDGEIMAWAGVMAHETDVGGMNFASWSPKATEIYQEGMRIPAVKIVDQGEIREDIVDFILAASRLPDLLGLDIRAFIATLNVATDRMQRLTERYGQPAIAETMSRMIDESEHALRERLRELPDAEIHVQDFIEHDGHTNALYTVDAVMTKRGDSLVFDFSGSSPQAPGFINTTRAGLIGGVAGALMPALGFNIPWTEGHLRPVEIRCREGLVVTAQHPAPVGSGTVEAIWTVANVAHRAISLLLASSEKYAHRAQAVSDGTMATFNFGGVNLYGERFGLHFLDPLAGGSGAYAIRDGIDGGGPTAVPMPSIADVETNEQAAPLLYLYRRLVPDSGGSGEFRGGASAEMALTVHGVDRAEGLVMTHGAEVPNSTGIFGGRPGCTVKQRVARSLVSAGGWSIAALTDSLDHGWQDLGPKPGTLPLAAGDVFTVRWQGGGGYGDPLDRAPEAVAADVENYLVSKDDAERTYGLVIGVDGAVDAAATTERRRELRTERLGYEPLATDSDSTVMGLALGPSLILRVEDGEWVVYSRAGAELSRGSTAWRHGALPRRVEGSQAGLITLHDELMITEWLCPNSGISLGIDVHRVDDEPWDDLLLAPPYQVRQGG